MQKDNIRKDTMYTDDNIRHLSNMEHIRTRPGMYIGRLSDGTLSEDGIYVLLKEVVDNSVDEFRMNAVKRIDITIDSNQYVTVRDYGRGIPQGKLVEAVSVLNTGGKYDTKAFKKSVGLNGVGLKAVNALSSHFEVKSIRDGRVRHLVFEKGIIKNDRTEVTSERNGTYIFFIPDNDEKLFNHFAFHEDNVESMLHHYTYLNNGLVIVFNDKNFQSKKGLYDLLVDRLANDPLYPIVHPKGEDIEIAFTHVHQYGEEYYSFVNGQYTSLGGTHLTAFKEHFARTVRDYFKKYEYIDIRNGLVAAIAINVEEPMFESSTKVKLGSSFGKEGETINKYVADFIKTNVDNYLRIHKNDCASIMEKHIKENAKERKEMEGVSRKVRERNKRINLHNPNLRDCRVHYNDFKDKLREESMIFITEGNSASGSITKVQNVNTQAVFSLRGKTLNCYGKSKKVCFENQEFNFLQSALNVENGIENLRYNKIIVATDADYDGMHIRLLVITFFLQIYPELVRTGHVYVLQTPLFRVRNKRTKIRNLKSINKVSHDKKSDFITRYCYTEQERLKAIRDLGLEPKITRFKGLGEISPDEFSHFIGQEMRIEQVTLHKNDKIPQILEYYMGQNTRE